MSIQRIEDNRLAIGGKVVDSLGRYASLTGTLFETTPDGSAWFYEDSGGTFPVYNPKPGEPYTLRNFLSNGNSKLWAPYAFPAGAKVGFIVTVELQDSLPRVIIGMVPGDYNFGSTIESIYSSGRYTGILTAPASGMIRTMIALSGSPAGSVIIKEVFYFDADLYTYENFLQSPISYLSLEQKDTPDSIEATSPRLGWADAIPTTGNWRVGDRLENTAWTGAFSSTIAWVCTVAGTPGTWKAVSLFDAYNASKDPYFYSYLGGAWVNQSTAPSTAVIDTNRAIMTMGATGTSAMNTTCECAVPYELVTSEWSVVAKTGVPSFRLQAAGASASVVIINDPVVPSSGTQDNALETFVANMKELTIYPIGGANSSLTFSRAIIRPKYPFLTKAPANFPASLPVLVIASYASAVPNIWYTHSVASTVSGGILTMSSYQPIWQRVTIRAGKTYRFRMNQVLLGATQNSVHIINSAGGLEVQSSLLPLTLGIVEVTFVAAVNGVGVTFQSNATTSTTDYARFYSE